MRKNCLYQETYYILQFSLEFTIGYKKAAQRAAFLSGDDETRTRDLRRDRPAF